MTVTGTNQSPAAAFTAATSGLTASFDAGGSSDPDGTVADFAWTFGDGSTGSGASPSHAYPGTGAYSVRLVVTDDDGSTDTLTKTVLVGGPGVAADDFQRTVTEGWGPADSGGNWTLSAAPPFTVDGGRGQIRLDAPRAGATANLTSVTATSVNGVVDLSVDKVGTGSGTYATFILRKSSTADYRIALIFGANGTATLSASRMGSGTETLIRAVTVAGLTYAADDVLRLRFGLAAPARPP